MKNSKKIKALPNGVDVVNVEKWTQILSACVAVKSKPWNTLNYWVWDTVTKMRLLKEFKSACEIVHL